MAAFVKTAIPNRYVGASSDTKPTGVGVGSMCYEHNTGATYITYDGTNWSQYAPTTYLTDISAETLTLSGTTGALTFSGAATIVAASGLTIPAFTLGGKLTAGSSEIEGSAFDINGGTIASVTLDGSIAGGDQSWTNVGDMTFAAGSILASGSTNGNTLLFKANDTTFLTFTTGATDVLTIANATMSGTWLADGTVTLPALTLGGAISGNAQTISNANVTVGASRTLDVSAGTLTLADNQISGDKVEGGTIAAITITDLTLATLTASGTATFNGNVVMGTMDIDDDSGAVTLVDMGVTATPADGTEESYAFKLDGNAMFTIYGKSDGAGAADELSLNCGAYLKLHITDTDGIAEGQIWYDASEDKLKFKTAAGVETISSS